MPKRAEDYASKAVNQYRSRDILSYLSIRYYCAADAARTDSWARENATQVVLGTHRGKYLKSLHFKCLDSKGIPQYRDIHVPSPSEALVEAFLIEHCGTAFEKESSDRLYSYKISSKSERSGYFVGYMDGIKRREAAIRSVTKSLPGGQVTYVDIKKFYDSISPEVATQSWQRFCDRNIIATPVPELGLKIIQNHAQETAGKSILTGPMFSHFVANLVLHDIDKIAEDLPSYYVRYVDDITLIGSEESNDASLTAIRSLLGKIDLALHDDKEKTFSLNCAEWESAASHIVANKHEGSWKKLVGNIKKCMIFFPDQVEALTHKLSEAGYRLPLSDYSLAVTETNSFQKIRSIGLWQWLLFRTESNVVQLILDSASVLADDYETDVFEILAEINQASTFLRKRLVSQIRYRLGRLMYLSSLSVLERLRVASIGVPELMFHTSIIEALVTRDCSKVVSLGVKVAQATAQLFRAAGMLAEFSEPVSTEAQIQGLATFIANGVQIGEAIFDAQHPILKIAIDGVDKDMLSREDSFIHELACLHGIGAPRHAATLNSAFDLADKISLDALDFDDGYYL